MSIRGITSFLIATIIALAGVSVPVSAKKLVNTAYNDTFLITELGMGKEGGAVRAKLNDLDYDIGDGVVTSFEGYRTKDNGWVLGMHPVVYRATGVNLDEKGELVASSDSEVGDQDLLETGWMAFFLRIARDEHFFILDLRECKKFRDIEGATCRLDEVPESMGYKYWAYLGDVKITDENIDDLMNPEDDGDPEDDGGPEDAGESDDGGEKDDEKEERGKGGEKRDEENAPDDGEKDDEAIDDGEEDESDDEATDDVLVGVVKDVSDILAISGVGNYTGGIKQTSNTAEGEEAEEIDEGVIGGVQEEDEIVNPPVGVVNGVKFGWMWLFWLTALISIFWFIVALFKRRKKEEDEKTVAAGGK